MQRNHFSLVKKLTNTSSGQLCEAILHSVRSTGRPVGQISFEEGHVAAAAAAGAGLQPRRRRGRPALLQQPRGGGGRRRRRRRQAR